MNKPLYERCELCGGGGKTSHGFPCPSCGGRGYAEIGLTVGQAEMLVRRSTERRQLLDLFIARDFDGRYCLRWPTRRGNGFAFSVHGSYSEAVRELLAVAVKAGETAIPDPPEGPVGPEEPAPDLEAMGVRQTLTQPISGSADLALFVDGRPGTRPPWSFLSLVSFEGDDSFIRFYRPVLSDPAASPQDQLRRLAGLLREYRGEADEEDTRDRDLLQWLRDRAKARKEGGTS